jgi:hypothetical protein
MRLPFRTGLPDRGASGGIKGFQSLSFMLPPVILQHAMPAMACTRQFHDPHTESIANLAFRPMCVCRDRTAPDRMAASMN